MTPLFDVCLSEGTRTERAARLEGILADRAVRKHVAEWITQLVPVERLVPETGSRWRPLVGDAIRFFFARLSAKRLAEKILEQLDLDPATPAETRLITLVSKMPALQKFGQVLARNRRLSPELRTALERLENGMSDVTVEQVHRILRNRLGELLEKYAVRLEAAMLSEASVSAVVRFTWRTPDRERERGVFKVLKPYVPEALAEELAIIRKLGAYLVSRQRRYGFAVYEVDELLTEVRLLLSHELDFAREQATLAEALRVYRSSIGIRVPRVIRMLCASDITAMSDETGVKVTEAFRHAPIRRLRIAEQLIEALIAMPLFSGRADAVFHADPHAGNLFYDEANRELIVLDWALAERLPREERRLIMVLAVKMVLQDEAGVRAAIEGLGIGSAEVIGEAVNRFFDHLPQGHSPGVLDAMRLLDRIALDGVRFPPSLFLFRKSLFTLDAVLQDIAGDEVQMDGVITRHFVTRWIASFGLLHAPFEWKDLLAMELQALAFPARWWTRRVLGIA